MERSMRTMEGVHNSRTMRKESAQQLDVPGIPENEAVDCDAALIPIGGTFIMGSAEEAGA